MYRKSIIYDKLSEQSIGEFAIRKAEIPRKTLLRFYNPIQGRFNHRLTTDPIPIVKLVEGSAIWMTDDPSERNSLLFPSTLAKGKVLIGGLGLGLLPTMLLRNEKVTSVDIVELYDEVINLVFGQLNFPSNYKVIKNDIRDYLKLGEKYDFIHIDIWPDIISPMKEIDEMIELARNSLNPGGRIHCWLQELYLNVKDRLPKKPVRGNFTAKPTRSCLICGKPLFNDFAGLCMDCADFFGVSELFMEEG